LNAIHLYFDGFYGLGYEQLKTGFEGSRTIDTGRFHRAHGADSRFRCGAGFRWPSERAALPRRSGG